MDKRLSWGGEFSDTSNLFTSNGHHWSRDRDTIDTSLCTADGGRADGDTDEARVAHLSRYETVLARLASSIDHPAATKERCLLPASSPALHHSLFDGADDAVEKGFETALELLVRRLHSEECCRNPSGEVSPPNRSVSGRGDSTRQPPSLETAKGKAATPCYAALHAHRVLKASPLTLERQRPESVNCYREPLRNFPRHYLDADPRRAYDPLGTSSKVPYLNSSKTVRSRHCYRPRVAARLGGDCSAQTSPRESSRHQWRQDELAALERARAEVYQRLGYRLQ